MEGLREGGIYLSRDGMTVTACSEPDGSWVLYVMEETEGEAQAESGKLLRRRFELFKADAEGRLFRYGRATDWRVADLDLIDTGQTVRVC